MSLVKSALKSDIRDFLSKNPENVKDADFADNLFKAYETYASDAQDISTDKPTGFPAKSSASPILVAAMALTNEERETNSGAAQKLGDALGLALKAFWGGTLFGMSIPLAPMNLELTAFVSTPGEPSAAAIALLEPTKNFNVAAGVWADAMDAFTKTVQVTITGMMPGPTGPVLAPPITAAVT